MNFEVNQAGKMTAAHATTGTQSKEVRKDNTPIFNFGDKNANGIVDKEDFDSELVAQLAEEKGLIGQAWDAVKNTIGSILDNISKDTPMKLKDQNGQFDDLASKYHDALVAVNKVDPKSRTWEKDENGRYKDCPEVIEFYKIEDEFKEAQTKLLGEPLFLGQEVLIESNGKNYIFEASKRGDSLIWIGSL